MVDCAAGSNYFSINFGWPLRGGSGRGGSEPSRLNVVKKFENRMSMTPN